MATDGVNTDCHGMMFVRLSVCPFVCPSVWDGRALWSYSAL